MLETVRWKVVLGPEQTLFALDDKGYEALARNNAELARWASEASWQLDFYRRTRNKAGDSK